jgi:hypothetical protein
MSHAAKSVSSHRAVKVYSSALNFTKRPSISSAQRGRITDTVQISKESLDKAEQLRKSKHPPQVVSQKPAGEPDLTPEQVRKIFMAAIKKCHPDHCANLSGETREEATRKTAQIIETYRSIQKILF